MAARNLKEIIFNAALLTDASDERVASVLGKSLKEVQEARRNFPESSLGRLDKLEFVTSVSNKSERTYYLWALSNGIKFIEWKLGLVSDLDPVLAVKQLFTDTIMKSRESIFSSNVEESSKEAIKWTALSIQLAKLLKGWVLDSEAAVHDLHIALEGSSLEDLPSLEDLLSN